MIKIVSIIISLVFVSFYFFPVEFKFLPGVNTKMAMAGCSLVVLAFNLARKQAPVIEKDIFWLSAIAMLVSLCGFTSVVYNNTPDYTYVTYIISMWVWLGGAYMMIWWLKLAHGGKVSILLIGNYLIAVCVLQCLLALAIDRIPALEEAVNGVVIGLGFVDNDTLVEANRLYGIGASLDVAGIRFSAVLVLIAYFCIAMSHKISWKYYPLYLIALGIIGVIGNAISRTTTVGLAIVVCYWIYATISSSTRNGGLRFSKWLLSFLVIFIPVVVFFYYTDPQIRESIRFGFEGFFSLATEGEWNVHSNEILRNMWVLPDNAKTWIIGDGYMENPNVTDPYYTGPIWHGYYMATDIGYLRFIFYFGLIGLLCFSAFFIYTAVCCIRRYKAHKLLFLMLLALNFIVWAKVSTDLFCLFAIFLVADAATLADDENDAVATERVMS